MNKEQYLLTCIAEEASEVVKDATKAIRFGLHDKNPTAYANNAANIVQELTELIALVEYAGKEGYIDITLLNNEETKKQKIKKYLKYAEYARQCGRLDLDWFSDSPTQICPNKNVNGICPHHNLQCSYPDCES